MRMNNIEKSVESISTVDENHYIVIVNFIDEYAYQDGSGETGNGVLLIKLRYRITEIC